MTYIVRKLNNNENNNSSLITGTLIKFISNKKKTSETNTVQNDSVILIDPGLNLDLLNNSDNLETVIYGQKLYDTLVEQWKEIIETVTTIIITQSSVDKLGSYSFLFNHFQELIYEKDLKIYATLPVANLGRLSTIELYCNKNLMGHFIDHKYEVEDIEQSFDYITPLKYSQPIKLVNNNVQFIAYNSGHSLGSSIVKFVNLEIENEFVLYFSEWSHVADSITDGTSILDRMNFWNPQNDVMHPSSIITNIDECFIKEESLQPWVKRSNKFKSYLFSNLNNKNLLLLPVDISTNFLKIFTLVAEYYQEYNRNDVEEDKLLDQFESFASNMNNGYYSGNNNNKNRNKKQKREQLPPIYLLSNSKGRSITYCKSMLEWLKESLLKNWNNKFNNNNINNNNNNNNNKNTNIVKTPFDQDIQVLTPEDFDSDERVSTLNKKKILDTGGILFVNDDFFLLNQIVESFNSQEKNPLLTKIHLIFTDIRQKHTYKNYLSNKEVELVLKDSDPIEDDKVLKDINNNIIERSKKRKELIASYDEKKKIAKEEAASLVYDIRDDEISESDDDEDDEDGDVGLGDGDSNHKKTDKELETEKEVENSPYDVVIKATTNSRNKMFKIKTSTYMRDEYGLIVDFNELFAAGEDDENENKDSTGNSNSVIDTVPNEILTKNVKEELNKTASKNKNDEDEDEDMYDDFMSLSRNSVYDQTGTYFDDLSYLNVLNKKIFYKSQLVQKKIHLRIATNFIDLTSIVDLKSSQIILPFFQAQNYVYFNENTTNFGGVAENIRVISNPEGEKFHTIMKNLDCVLSPNLEETLHWETVLNGKYQISKVSCDLVKVRNQLDGTVKYKIEPSTKPLSSDKINESESSGISNEENGDLQLGNVTLSKIRNLLLQQNHEAVFLGNGSLLVDNAVFIGKVNNSVVEVKGKPSLLYYQVRKIVNGMLASI
ncbi:hypothetical protein ACO0SA_004223 [Hanseniaspora valbyensis]